MAGEFELPRPRGRVRALVIGAVLLLTALAGAGLVTFVSGDTVAGASSSRSTADGELAPLVELYEALTANAVDAPDEEALVDAAIDAMLGEIDDPYAQYFPEEDFAAFNQSLDGTFSGVGLMLEDTPDGPVIVSVLEDTPADEAGIEEGERIVSVDGSNVRDEPLEAIVAKVKGDAGTEVTLGLEGGDAGPRDVTVTRAEFDLPILRSEMLDGMGYVRLLQFTDGSGERVREAVRGLLDDGADGIVLDLRRNPGGRLNEAVAVASVFIEDGPIVGIEERSGERETMSARGDAFADIPLAVLIDGGSASASEIVAGAVEDADRGRIVGETSFGKGTVQTIAPLPDGSGAKFTTARYFTPSGDSIEGSGIEPDVVVETDREASGLDDDDQVQAALDELAARVGADG